MEKLFQKLQNYSLENSIEIEKSDRQFLALKKLYENKKMSDENYLFLIIINSLICYQLSGKGEDYWEEFSIILEDKNFKNFLEIYNFFENFIPNSKNNKRFVDTKLKRVKKIEEFYEKIINNSNLSFEKNINEGFEFYYKNMDILVLRLSKIMNQKIDAKTIVFAIKMFSYGARNIFNLEYFPENLMIPIDSRLENLYKKYSNFKGEKINNQDIKNFYLDLSEKLNIPLLHLDAILWVNYDEFFE